MHSKLLCEVQTSPVCSVEYATTKLAAGDTLEEQLDQQVLLTTDEKMKEWRLICPEIEPKEIIVCDSYFSVVKSAEMGLGIALGVFPAINNWVNANKLCLIRNQLFDTKAGYWFIYPKQRSENQLINSCYTWSKELFSTLPKLELRVEGK